MNANVLPSNTSTPPLVIVASLLGPAEVSFSKRGVVYFRSLARPLVSAPSLLTPPSFPPVTHSEYSPKGAPGCGSPPLELVFDVRLTSSQPSSLSVSVTVAFSIALPGNALLLPLITLMLIGGAVTLTFPVPPGDMIISSFLFAELTSCGLFASQVPAYTVYAAVVGNGNTFASDFTTSAYSST